MAPRQVKEVEVITNLIEAYKNMPYLWDKRNKDYKNQSMRKEGHKILLEIYKEFYNEATTATVVKKMQNLRTNYIKELKKVRDSTRTATFPDDIYTPTLWYFNGMQFLENHCDPQSSSRDQDSIESKDLLISRSETESIYITEPTINGNKKIKTKYCCQQKEEKCMEMKEEEWDIIGKSIGLQLKHLNRNQFFIAQKIIHDTLYYAQIGKLSEKASITGLLDNQHEMTMPSPEYYVPSEVQSVASPSSSPNHLIV